jgi:PAS domain S-box-containing protein
MNERTKAIILIGLIIFSLSGAYLYQGYNHYTSLVDQVIQRTEEEFNSAIDSVQQFSFSPYSIRIDNLLLTSPNVISSFAKRDREALYQEAFPKYKALMDENVFFKVMHFHLPDGTTLLRMHNPSFFGDDLTAVRPIVTMVHQQQKLLTGYEIGRHGLFYRIVHPVFVEGEYIGALEFGIQVNELIQVLKQKIEAPVTSFFLANLLQKATHDSQANSYIQCGEFYFLTEDHSIYTTLPKNLELKENDQRIEIRDQTFILHSHSLFRDYQDNVIGGIVVLQDITPFLKQKRQFLVNSSILVFSLSLFAIIILYFGFGKIMASLRNEIAERKRAQGATTKAKREWERTVDAVPDLITLLDPNFRIIRTNHALPGLLQLPMDEVLGKRCYHIFCGKEAAPECCPYRTLQRDKQQCSNEIYYEKLGFFFDVILSPLYDDNGKFIGAVHIARNITQKKALEQKVRQDHLYLQSILEASTNTTIVATDNKLRIKYCNPETERLLGYPSERIINRSLLEVHAHNGVNAADGFEEAINQAQNHGFHQFLLQCNNHILDTQISSLTDEEGNFTGVLLIGRDVTAQKNTEARLVKAEKFEAIGLMAGGVAHDLNNILSGIVSYPDLLCHQLPEDSEMREPLLQIQKAGKRAAVVVADLLTMARGVAKVKEVTSLNELIQEYLSSLEYNKLSSLYPKVTVNTQLDQNCWNCICSPTHIVKVVMNLLTNAIEAIPDTGNVFLTTYNQEGKPHQAGDLLQGSAFTALQVRDTGPGISQKHLEHIFEPFYTTKKMGRSGSGLGLSVVWNTIKEHGGSVTVNSCVEGSTFTVYLPVCRKQGKKDVVKLGNELKALNGKGSIVLIIDDDKDQRIIAREMLTVLGYSAHTVSSGEEAIVWLQTNRADLLLLDMLMDPGMNGRKTYEEVIRLYPEQKALIASGLSKNSEMEKALQLGVNGFIAKPYSLEELGERIQQIINSEENPT